ncbi:MAG TPA: sigma-70 family RNA polymerase sigma factor [Sedimentisphaerales bacterium]|nr:sigma-70 family RNA polymerase sigma factor [Sedimentisphaerales bacterium]
MLNDVLLIWKFRSGDSDALAKIYEDHRQNLLRIAAGLLNQTGAAEDVVHDVFVQLAQSPQRLRLQGNLRSFLATCVVNRARNANKAAQRRRTGGLDQAEAIVSDNPGPERWILDNERFTRLRNALAELPYEQREVVVLHLQGGAKFRDIAKSQGVSINTVQSRYRYGLERLRSLLDGEV